MKLATGFLGFRKNQGSFLTNHDKPNWSWSVVGLDSVRSITTGMAESLGTVSAPQPAKSKFQNRYRLWIKTEEMA